MKNAFLSLAIIIFCAILAFLFLKALLLALLFLFIVLVLWSWRLQRDQRNILFMNGIVPDPMPDGLCQGVFLGHHTSWRGKKFQASASTGINLFDDGRGSTIERYPFKTYIGKGLQEHKKDVMKIDYDVEENPFWLAFILDEIVQIAPGQYLGKMHIKLIPGLPFTVLYFELKK